MKIWDCFTFLNEIDLLEIRLRHLWDRVDRFVIVEGSKTHSGQSKDRVFEPRQFAWALDKIVYVAADLPNMDDAWEMERYQRHLILKGIKGADPEDIVLISDCDEIPSHSAIDHLRTAPMPCGFQQKLCVWYINMVCPKYEWVGTVAVTAGKLIQFGYPEFYRRNRFAIPRIPNGGYHFTFLGSPEQASYKISVYAHEEYNTPENRDLDTLKKRKDLGLDPFGSAKDVTCELDLRDPDFPPYLLSNKDRYPELFKTWPRP